MTEFFLVSGEDPVNLSATIDTSSDLQVAHGSDSLVNYEQTVHIEHDDLQQSGGYVRIKLVDYTSGGVTWTTSATHSAGGSTVSWSRESDHIYHDFGPMSVELDIDLTATSNESTSTTKQRVFKLKTKPTDSQPDRGPA